MTKILAALLLIAIVRPADAELSICNDGGVDLFAAEGEWKNEGFLLLDRTWHVSGWYELPRKECRTVYTGGTSRFYFAFAFTDSRGRWGSAEFEPDGGPYEVAQNDLCVRQGVFEYKLDDEDPPGCPSGYFTLPSTLVFDPDGDASFTLTVGLERDDVAGPTGLDLDEFKFRSNAPVQDRGGALDAAATVVGAVIGIAIAVAGASEADRAAAPQPFASGTLNAALFGHTIVRRAYEDQWFTADGNLLQPGYALDGATSSPVLDAPTQRPADDPAVVAALAQTNRGLASIALNRGANVSSEGRLEYDFQWMGGSTLQRYWVNVATLDFARGRRLSGDGVQAFRIPCRDAGACVVAFEEDAAGKLGTPLLYDEIDVRFATDADGEQVWAGLLGLRSLYPAEPVVTQR